MVKYLAYSFMIVTAIERLTEFILFLIGTNSIVLSSFRLFAIIAAIVPVNSFILSTAIQSFSIVGIVVNSYAVKVREEIQIVVAQLQCYSLFILIIACSIIILDIICFLGWLTVMS